MKWAVLTTLTCLAACSPSAPDDPPAAAGNHSLPDNGDLADRQVLDKTLRDPRIEDRRWILTELRGQPFEAGNAYREAFILLDPEAGRISGNTSCNNFFGRYELAAGNRIRVTGSLGATMMACPDMAIEQTFLDVLSSIDNYSVADDELTLNRARMAPLARFRAAATD